MNAVVEKEDKTLAEKLAHALWLITGRAERERNEMEARKPLDPGPREEPDFAQKLRELEGRLDEYENEPKTRNIYYGHHTPPPQEPLSEKHQRRIVSDLFFKIVFWIITAAVGFAYGRLWDHEHRISVIEGREVPHVGSP